jgi:hypothetical protein
MPAPGISSRRQPEGIFAAYSSSCVFIECDATGIDAASDFAVGVPDVERRGALLADSLLENFRM